MAPRLTGPHILTPPHQELGGLSASQQQPITNFLQPVNTLQRPAVSGMQRPASSGMQRPAASSMQRPATSGSHFNHGMGTFTWSQLSDEPPMNQLTASQNQLPQLQHLASLRMGAGLQQPGSSRRPATAPAVPAGMHGLQQHMRFGSGASRLEPSPPLSGLGTGGLSASQQPASMLQDLEATQPDSMQPPPMHGRQRAGADAAPAPQVVHRLDALEASVQQHAGSVEALGGTVKQQLSDILSQLQAQKELLAEHAAAAAEAAAAAAARPAPALMAEHSCQTSPFLAPAPQGRGGGLGTTKLFKEPAASPQDLSMHGAPDGLPSKQQQAPARPPSKRAAKQPARLRRRSGSSGSGAGAAKGGQAQLVQTKLTFGGSEPVRAAPEPSCHMPAASARSKPPAAAKAARKPAARTSKAPAPAARRRAPKAAAAAPAAPAASSGSGVGRRRSRRSNPSDDSSASERVSLPHQGGSRIEGTHQPQQGTQQPAGSMGMLQLFGGVQPSPPSGDGAGGKRRTPAAKQLPSQDPSSSAIDGDDIARQVAASLERHRAAKRRRMLAVRRPAPTAVQEEGGSECF